MHLLTRRLALAVAAIALPSAVAADPINVTGFLTYQRGGALEIQLTGDAEGFTFGTRTSPFATGQAPWHQIEVRPGSTLNLATVTDGTTTGGRATFRGETHGFSAASDLSILLRWGGSLPIPADFTGGTLTGTLSFDSFLAYFPNVVGGTSEVFPLIAAGGVTGTFTFAPHPAFPGTGSMELVAARYEINGGDPVPEPASMLLIASGAAGFLVSRRRRPGQVSGR